MKNQHEVNDLPLIIQRVGDWKSLIAAVDKVESATGVTGIMVLACESNGLVPKYFDEFLLAMNVPIFGGIFPKLIANGEYFDAGYIVLGLTTELDIYTLPLLSEKSLDLDEWLAKTIPFGKLLDARTMFVFVDGLSMRVGELMESLFNTVGLQVNFIGGGAGSLTSPNSECLITSQGVLRDAAVLVLPKMNSQVHVAHGWLPVAGPFEVTSAQGNMIKMLDWEPAMDLYRGVIESHVRGNFDFAKIATVYPLGIARLDMEFVVRDLVESCQDGSLVCVVDVPSGSLVHIMNGNEASLLSAASAVRTLANTSATKNSSWTIDLVMDCISRAIYLGEKTQLEVNSLHNSARTSIGAFTLGEIANNGQDCLEFHNKTVAVATLWD